MWGAYHMLRMTERFPLPMQLFQVLTITYHPILPSPSQPLPHTTGALPDFVLVQGALSWALHKCQQGGLGSLRLSATPLPLLLY